MEITLCPVSSSDWLAVVKLSVADSQRHFIASNAFSLAQAAYTPNVYPLSIYAGNMLIGFAMYGYDQDFQPPMWGIWRFMIDQRYQKQGYGRQALSSLLQKLAAERGHGTVYISAVPENTVAIALYESAGFRRTGELIEGEVLLTISL